MNPLDRLGYGTAQSGRDYAGLKNHAFFKGVNFEKLKDENFKPTVASEVLNYFSEVSDDEEQKEGGDKADSLKAATRKVGEPSTVQKMLPGDKKIATRYSGGTTLDNTVVLTKQSFAAVNKLGEGAYGTVCLVKKRDDDRLFAVKEISKSKIMQFNKIDAVFRERDLLESSSDNAFVVLLECSFQDDDNLYFVTEYVKNGSLESIMKDVKLLPVDTVRFWTAEIVLALENLHKNDIAHRDLKPGNILIDNDYHTKLCDFGEAKIIKDISRAELQKEYDNAMEKLKREE